MAPDAKEIRQAEREAKQDEKARLRQEKTDAYIALQNEQDALYAENEALAAPFSDTDTDGTGPDTDTDGPIPAETQRVIDANNARIDLLEKQINKIYSSTLGFVEGRSKKQRLADMVAAASGAEAAKAAPKEQIAELKTDTLALAAQHLMAAGLLPGDLKGDEPKRSQAARLVGREGASPAELSAFADELQPAYDIEMNIKKAAEDMEKGVVVGRTMDAIKEVAGNPAKMGGAALGLLGAWLLYSAVGHGPSDGAMKWIKGILGVAGLGVGIGVVSGALSYKNIGLGDAVEKLTGVRADEAFSTESMDKVRHLFDGMPSTDTDAVDDFIRIMDAPVENVADMFRDALENGATEVEAARLLGNGLSSKERKFVDEGSLYTSCSWFFLKCYEQGLAKGDLATTTDEKTKLLLGLDWSKKNFKGHQMGTAVAAFELVRLGSGTGIVETTGTPETGISNPALAKLEEQVPSFGEVLEETPRAGVYLISGYPVRYTNVAGNHIFTDLLKPTEKFTEVSADVKQEAALEVVLRGISETAATRAKDLFDAKYKAEIPDIKTRLKYRPSDRGLWELDPKEPRSKPKGLPNHRADEKLNLVFYVDPTKQETRVDLDSTLGHEPPYKDVAEVKKQFEKELLKGLVLENTSHVMLGTPFKVLDYVDSTSSTTVFIEYGDNAQGKLVYGNDALVSYELKPDAALETVWNATAEKRIADFLNTPLVQTELLKATGAFTPNNLSGWMASIGKFFGNGIQWLKDDSIMAQFHNDWEKQVITKMKELVYHPTTGLSVDYVKTLFRTTSSVAPTPTTGILKKDFDTEERTFFAAKLTDIQGKVSATVVPEKEPDQQLTITQAIDKARGDGAAAIAIALAPLKDRIPATMPSRFASAAQSIGNLFTGDAARTELYKKEAGKWQQELEKRVSALFLIPSGPVPAGAPSLAPTVPTRDQVQQEIDRIQVEIQREAVKYVGLNNQDAVRKLLLAPVEVPGAHPDWKAASIVMADYLSNHFKWENYGVFPNPENLAAVMDIWYEKIGDPTVAPLAGPAEEYAAYFRYEVWVRLGGNRDWSPDRLYDGTIESVSDSQFKANIGGLRGGIKDFSTWSKAIDLRPPVPSMEPSFEKYKPLLKTHMQEWFAKQNDIQVWSRIYRWGPMMFRWPEVYKKSFDRRMEDIFVRSTDPNTLYKDMEDLKKFTAFEQGAIYEKLIMAGAVPESDHLGLGMPWAVFVETEVTKDFKQMYFDAVPRDLNGYMGYVNRRMAKVLDVKWHTPNLPGFPFITIS